MTRSEITELAQPLGFKPFVLVTASSGRYNVRHPDFIDIPPMGEGEEGEEIEPSYVMVYGKSGVAKWIDLDSITEIDFQTQQK